jgi:hypothetical protein
MFLIYYKYYNKQECFAFTAAIREGRVRRKMKEAVDEEKGR